jgi:hypothetical protein
MKTRNSGRGLARDGYVGKPKSKRVVPPPVKKVAQARVPRDWTAQNRRLVERGDVTIWVDLSDIGARGVGVGAGSGRPYPEVAIRLCVVVMAPYHLPLPSLGSGQAEGFTRMLLRGVGASLPTPDYATICRRRRGLTWEPPELRKGHSIVVDATGITVRSTGAWLRDKHRNKSKTKFVKLHAAIDCDTGEFLSTWITEADGKGSGDVSVGPRLIREAAQFCHGPPGILGDRAYDAKSC